MSSNEALMWRIALDAVPSAFRGSVEVHAELNAVGLDSILVIGIVTQFLEESGVEPQAFLNLENPRLSTVEDLIGLADALVGTPRARAGSGTTQGAAGRPE
jgi:hypothetical protein